MRAASSTICSKAGALKSANCISAIGRRPAIAAPTATPTIDDSASGVSMMRSGPNSSMNPSVARNTPPRTPTSSPSTITRSSRRSSPSIVSWTAWTLLFSATSAQPQVGEAIGPPLAHEPVGGLDDLLAVRLAEVVAVHADRRAVLRRRQRAWRRFEQVERALGLERLAQDERRGAAGHVFVDHEQGVRALHRLADESLEVERVEGA